MIMDIANEVPVYRRLRLREREKREQRDILKAAYKLQCVLTTQNEHSSKQNGPK